MKQLNNNPFASQITNNVRYIYIRNRVMSFIFKFMVMFLLVSSATGQTLLSNGNFSQLKDGVPEGWNFVNGNKKWGKLGTTSVITGSGGNMVEILKNKPSGFYPQLRSNPVKVTSGSTYTLKMRVKCNSAWNVYISMTGSSGNNKAKKRKITVAGKDDFNEVSKSFKIPGGYDLLAVGCYPESTTNMLVSYVSLEKEKTGKAVSETAPDPIHGLDEFSRRTSFLPLPLRGLRNEYPEARLVFHDTKTGAEITKMTRYPGITRHVYSNSLTWDANGSNIFIRSSRGGDPKIQFFTLKADGFGLARHRHAGRVFDAVRPGIVWCRQWPPVENKMRLYSYNIKTGEKHYLPGDYDSGGLAIPHPDGRKLLVASLNQNRTARYASAHIIDIESGKTHSFQFPYVTHQVWFTKQPDYSISFNLERKNKYVAEKKLEGSFVSTVDGKWHKIRDRHMTHRGFSPDGKKIAFHQGKIKLINVDGTDEKNISNYGSGHLSWTVTPAWFVATAQNSIRCIGAQNQKYDYIICYPNTQLEFSEYFTEAHLDSSPDGTKVGFASSMLQDTDFYQVLSRRPMPPLDLKAVVKNNKIELSWLPPMRSKEVAGYFIYTSGSPDKNFTQVNPEKIKGTRCSLPVKNNGESYFYVTAIENSGTESQPSMVAMATPDGSWKGAFCQYYEFETETSRLPFKEQFDAKALDLLGLLLSTGKGEFVEIVKVPFKDRYSFYVRICGKGQVSVAGLKPVMVDSEDYKWVKLGTLNLTKGVNSIKIAAGGNQLVFDMAFLSNSTGLIPNGKALYDIKPPAAPSGLKVLETASTENTFEWLPVKDMDLAYYNVYSSTQSGVKCTQASRVGSPLSRRFRDWGLKPSTKYFYRITAVDRRGNESAPSSEVCALTEKGGKIFIRKQAGTEKMDKIKASNKYTVEEIAAMNGPVNGVFTVEKGKPLTLSLNIPETGKYLLWIKAGIAAKRDESSRISKYPILKVDIGHNSISWNSGLNLASLGHVGPVPGVFVWSKAGAPGDGTELIPLKQGKVDIKISAPDPQTRVNLSEIILTDNFGFEPEGIVNWLSPAKRLGKLYKK